VIGTGTLGQWSHTHSTVAGATVYSCDEPFTMQSVPFEPCVSSEPRYGFTVNGVPGKIWATDVRKLVTFSAASSDG
jgi:hypothetical protein